MPALGQYVHTAAFAVFALVLLDGAGEGGRHADLRRVVALLAGMAAAFGIAGGLIIWPVLLWAAWRCGLPRGWLIAVALTGIAFIAVYVLGLHSHASVGSLEPMRLLRMLDYSIRFPGLPWSQPPLSRGSAAPSVASFFGRPLFLLRRGPLAPPRRLGASLGHCSSLCSWRRSQAQAGSISPSTGRCRCATASSPPWPSSGC
jgi:hypothetical protein